MLGDTMFNYPIDRTVKLSANKVISNKISWYTKILLVIYIIINHYINKYFAVPDILDVGVSLTALFPLSPGLSYLPAMGPSSLKFNLSIICCLKYVW